ncbi:MAG: DNA mismatch repair endonuclease MutL [Polyangiaceae bacterium]
MSTVDPTPPARRRVRVLPEDLANQIAAGEVVERPSSVVKELVENALDAGARKVRVDVEGGGIGLARIADDGHGMDRDDATLALLRHATSKIQSLDDLAAVRSFGFRGEALPSIASVSRLVLRTRRSSDAEGTEVRVEGGGAPIVSPCGVSVGTIVEVRDLFFNVPARRKFLRATATESAHVTEVVQAMALGAPHVSVVLSREGRVAREWLRAGSREERTRQIHAGEELAVCKGERGPLAVEAFLSRPERARSGAVGLTLLVNGRVVKDRSLSRGVALAYGSVLEPGRYPIGVVYIDLPPELVDVNVHPQKAEVRFADGRAASDALYRILADNLTRAFGLPVSRLPGAHHQKVKPEPAPEAGDGWVWSGGPPGGVPGGGASSGVVPGGGVPGGVVPDGGVPGGVVPGGGAGFAGGPGERAAHEERSREAERTARDGAGWGAGGGAGERPTGPVVDDLDAGSAQSEMHGAPGFSGRDADAMAAGLLFAPGAGALPGRPAPIAYPPLRADDVPPMPGPSTVDQRTPFRALRYLAQLRATFLLCEGPDGLYILDQHAAAERVTYHRLRTSYRARTIATQKLLFPVIVSVSAGEVALVEEGEESVLAAGFELRPAGPTHVAVHAVPQLLARASPERLVRDLLAEVSHTGERAFSGAIDLALATMACHGSLRAGERVSADEVTALLQSLDEVDFAGHCPHGRPVVHRVSYAELELRVGRR